ncbi:MAG: TatD family hydrolase [Candidatus Synoicihabitans palmerolidicus]|nr:TatD family hydrolase [Candidatus Synoicihabitans palmerolidicus]
MLYDAHNHLQFDELSDHLNSIIPVLNSIRLGGAVVNGTHPDDDWDAVARLDQTIDWVLPSYGIHPWDVGNRPPYWREKFPARFDASPHAAVGEIGLDRWILDSAHPEDPRLIGVRRAPFKEQTEVFRWQLAWAASHHRPVTIHCLQAWGPLLEILQTTRLPSCGFLIHAYGGPAEIVPAFASLGAYFSFNTSFINPHKNRQRTAFREVPLDRLLIETDAPATPPPAPVHELPTPPHQSFGHLNHPANIAQAYHALAALRELPPDELEPIIESNFECLFISS